MVDSEKIKELETRLSDLRSRWPAHSVPPSMFEELERLEDELEESRREEE